MKKASIFVGLAALMALLVLGGCVQSGIEPGLNGSFVNTTTGGAVGNAGNGSVIGSSNISNTTGNLPGGSNASTGNGTVNTGTGVSTGIGSTGTVGQEQNFANPGRVVLIAENTLGKIKSDNRVLVTVDSISVHRAGVVGTTTGTTGGTVASSSAGMNNSGNISPNIGTGSSGTSSYAAYSSGYTTGSATGASDNSSNMYNTNNINTGNSSSGGNMTVGSAVTSTGNGWYTLAITPMTVDITRLRDDNVKALLADTQLEAGTYDQIRIHVSGVSVESHDTNAVIGPVLGNASSTGNATFESNAVLPSDTITLDTTFSVDRNGTTAILLDMDSTDSLHVTDDGRNVFAPAITVDKRYDASIDSSNPERVRVIGGTSTTSDTNSYTMDINGNMVSGTGIPRDARLTVVGNSVVYKDNTGTGTAGNTSA